MTDEFRKEIRKIAEKTKASTAEAADSVSRSDSDRESYLDAVGEFFKAAHEAVYIYNETLGSTRLTVHRLNSEFFDLFLGITGRRDGFTIVSPSKMLIMFDEDPFMLTVIGKKRIKDGAGAMLSSSTQLIKIAYNKDQDGIIYADNTGGRVDPRDLTTLFIKWVCSD